MEARVPEEARRVGSLGRQVPAAKPQALDDVFEVPRRRERPRLDSRSTPSARHETLGPPMTRRSDFLETNHQQLSSTRTEPPSST